MMLMARPAQNRLWNVCVLTLLAILGSLSLYSFNAHSQTRVIEMPAEDQVADQLKELDSRYQTVLDRYLRETPLSPSREVPYRRLQTTLQSDIPVLHKLAAIRANLPMLEKQLPRALLASVLRFLYAHNDTATVQRLVNRIKLKGHSGHKAENYFLLAQYYYARSNWSGVIASLSAADFAALDNEDQHYAYLLYGYALQQQKKHRRAYEYYKKIPSGSPYYAYAKLNEGTAYLRQGWWTEAHIQFNDGIKAVPAEDDMKNRLYSTLGFSQLHYEFFRDARDTLRKVSLQSPYTNKALMGLGLAAAYQKDFSGALNAFEILAKKVPQDLNVDEAKLLLAKSYEEVNNAAGAAKAYQEAIQYYAEKNTRLGHYLRQLATDSQSNEVMSFRDFEQLSVEIYGRQQFIPDYFHKNYETLSGMLSTPVDGDLQKALQALKSDYRNQLKSMIRDNIGLRKAMTESYLSQAKLGMAQLYDK